MASRLDKAIERWQSAGVVDVAVAERIRAFESQHGEQAKHSRSVGLVFGLGGLMLAAGVFLFVAANWQRLSPTSRFVIVLLLVSVFHALGGLVAGRLRALATVFHAVGTACLGAGIFLAAQIFNLEENWPSAFLLWGIGAAVAWWILREWPQSLYVAVLFPIWAAGEWSLRTWGFSGGWRIAAEAMLLLAFAYLTAVTPEKDTPARRAVSRLAWLAIIPLTFWVLEGTHEWRDSPSLPLGRMVLGWTAAIVVPLLLAAWLRGRNLRALSLHLGAIPWVLILGTMDIYIPTEGIAAPVRFWHHQGPYIWCALGALGLLASGVSESRKDRINLGLVGFGVTVLTFYFSSVMSKMGRSVSLITLGLLFVVLGMALHKARQRLLERMGN